jgi:hypothetical protein
MTYNLSSIKHSNKALLLSRKTVSRSPLSTLFPQNSGRRKERLATLSQMQQIGGG